MAKAKHNGAGVVELESYRTTRTEPEPSPRYLLQLELDLPDAGAARRAGDALRRALESGMTDRTALAALAGLWRNTTAVGLYESAPTKPAGRRE